MCLHINLAKILPCRIIFVGHLLPKKINSVPCTWKKLTSAVLLDRIELYLSVYLWSYGNDSENAEKPYVDLNNWRGGQNLCGRYECDRHALMGLICRSPQQQQCLPGVQRWREKTSLQRLNFHKDMGSEKRSV